MIKAFKGMIADQGQDRIRLSTNDGKLGYKIKKFEIMTNQPHVAGTDTEHVVMVWKTERTGAELVGVTTQLPDFTETDLLAVGISINDVTGSGHGYWDKIIFEGETFNQDIYITNRDEGGSTIACNYYLELEQIKLSDAESMVATIRNIKSSK